MNYAILELHDVAPYYKREFLKALEIIEELNIEKFSLLVVPYFWEAYSIAEDRDFILLIKSLKQEVLLHGYTHKGIRKVSDILWTDGEGEFSGIDLYETYTKVSFALELLNYVGLKAKFFVPPAWIGNKHLEDVLYSLGFEGVAYRWYIKDLISNLSIKSPALTFSNRPLISWLSIKLIPELERLYKRHSILRLAIHMADLRDQRKINLWKGIISKIKEKRRWISYEELFSKSRSTSSLKGFQPAWGVVH